MKLENSTDFSDQFIRRMVSWICRAMELSLRKVKRARFTHCSHGVWRGRAHYRSQILVRICRADYRNFPFTNSRNSHAPEYTISDRIEALVKVTAHELSHLERWHRLGLVRNSEANVDRVALLVLKEFRANRETLLAAWSAAAATEPVTAEPEPVAVATDPGPSRLMVKRAAKAAADLKRWERKAKLAKTKVAAYRRRVAYYTRKLGELPAEQGEQ